MATKSKASKTKAGKATEKRLKKTAAAKASAKVAPKAKPAAKAAPKAKAAAAKPAPKKIGPKSGKNKVAAKPLAAKKPTAKKSTLIKATKPKAAPKAKKSTAKKPTTGKAAPKGKQLETRLTWQPREVVGAKWYVAQTASNYEKRVQTLIREAVLLQAMQPFVEDVVIPTEPVMEVKKGIKVQVDKKFFPGYVLIKCNLTDAVWHLIRYTPHVSGFLGSERGKKPFPISEAEAQRILNVMAHGAEKPKNLVAFELGEMLRVKEGPFANFTGSVEAIDEEKERLTVSVSIFGRSTPIELDYSQVEKA
jgi:transcriptional antiterminator NusG